ncbi:hypothetical protein Mfla_1121 [Methylobacillus flagellatus KT]|uniref:Uncharacterized protein n=1 Tax=Methylobacillus flagellatus (strain ATCC 51484 / DSM 6875 / VKM B-1610 / KT) TaxID=265072 RepID=Q1H298_METFK|nr:hypothetical protein Mfla_1121 [Methylobacillus flagellatus KT]
MLLTPLIYFGVHIIAIARSATRKLIWQLVIMAGANPSHFYKRDSTMSDAIAKCIDIPDQCTLVARATDAIECCFFFSNIFSGNILRMMETRSQFPRLQHLACLA